MNHKKALTYFQNVWLARKSTNGWYTFDCPFCASGSNKRGVNFALNLVKCFKCGSAHRYRIVDFIEAVNDDLDYKGVKSYLDSFDESDIDVLQMQEMKAATKSEVSLPEGFRSILEGDNVLSKRARKYLEGRGFDLIFLDKLGVGYCDRKPSDPEEENYFGRIIVPFKRMGVLKYYEGRSFINEEPKYKNPAEDYFGVGKSELVFNEDALYLHDKVFVCEGTYDALTLGNAVALKGKVCSSTQKSIIIKSGISELVIALDPDAQNEAYKLAMQLVDHIKIKVLTLPKDTDVNDLGYKYINDLEKRTEYSDFMDLIDKM